LRGYKTNTIQLVGCFAKKGLTLQNNSLEMDFEMDASEGRRRILSAVAAQ